jgi:hypothetical protein
MLLLLLLLLVEDKDDDRLGLAKDLLSLPPSFSE